MRWLTVTVALGVFLALLATPVMSVVAQESSAEATPTTGAKAGQLIEGPFDVGSGFEVSYFYFVANESNAYGEIKNSGEQPAKAPHITIQPLDENGYEYGDNLSVFTHDLWVPPGGSIPFTAVRSDADPPLSALFTFSVVGSPRTHDSEEAMPKIGIEDIPAEGRVGDADAMTGRLRNESEQPLEIGAVVGYYAPDGTTLGLCTQGPKPVPPGKTIAFQIPDPMGFSCLNATYAIETFRLPETAAITYRVFPTTS